jgi:hypothetical protein
LKDTLPIANFFYHNRKNMKPLNCWEFWNCPEEVKNGCPAFITNYGIDCYDFSENYCPRAEKNFRHCRECPWYKKIQSEFRKKEDSVRL